jgi:hypothetical protein
MIVFDSSCKLAYICGFDRALNASLAVYLVISVERTHNFSCRITHSVVGELPDVPTQHISERRVKTAEQGAADSG